jgi:hypothetical protein
MELRRPRFGGHLCIGQTTGEDWQLDPIEIIDGVPFLVTTGGLLIGMAEIPYHYLVYCTEECDWNKFVYKSKTAEEKQKALEKLLASPKWKEPLTKEEKKFLSSQIE